MATELIATGSTAVNSSDVVVAAGTPVTVSLKGVADGQARVVVILKDDAGGYTNLVGALTASQPSAVISGPGTYRFTRIAGATCGVFSG